MADPRETLAKEIAVAAAVSGTELSKVALAAMVDDLLAYPLDRAVNAIRRARREVPRLTLNAVIDRVELGDGHPGPDEAWAMCPATEADSVVWTEQMSRAFFVAQPLLDRGDRIGARMAFKDAYAREVEQARLARAPIKWTPSLGTDAEKREQAIAIAVERGRIGHETAAAYLPAPATDKGADATKLIAHDDSALRARWADLTARLKAGQALS